MRIFAIADLHLPGGDCKPMDVFGPHWKGHFDKISSDWRRRVSAEDLVLLPGDLSWAMRLEEAAADLESIGALPGIKLLLRGNHDYWWGSVSRVRAMLPEGMFAVQNDALRIGDIVFCGSRGWTHPDGADDENRKIYERELIRLRMSLEEGKRKGGRMIVMTHYPPLNERHGHTPMSSLIASYHPTDVVYGHLHGPSLKGAFNGTLDGIRYHCVSCDGLGFRLRLIDGDEGPQSACPEENPV